MALDKETVKRVAGEKGFSLEEDTNGEVCIFHPLNPAIFALDDLLEDFAQAIYELGVQNERERAARMAEEEWSRMKQTEAAHYRNSPEPFNPEHFGFDQFRIRRAKELAEAIRKGE